MAETYRFQVGGIECRLISDGTFAYPAPAHMFFANAPGEQLEEVLRERGIDPREWIQYESPYSALLVHADRRMVLVDTGAGSLESTTGKLLKNLRAEGIEPGDIDVVMLTHAHPDHVGGAADAEGKPTFPRARYVISRIEWQFWTSSPDLGALAVPDFLKGVLVGIAQTKLASLQRQLELIPGEVELAPGVRAIPAPGHTPGQMIVEVSSGGQRLLHLADVYIHPIHVAHPEWCAAVDYQLGQTIATRQQVLNWACADQPLVAAMHFAPFPGLGRLVPEGMSWCWRPE